ncbi:MAG: cytochrome c [Gemmatimonadota bacterium]|nr:cytochrome c [Gemmatimonadota bacterium]MDH5758009.1 cytochrome c [Gemmatimonadota bacterium]
MRNARTIRLLAAGLVLAVVSGCKPLDDTMVMVFGRSMRDQRSFDPYENPRPAPTHSVSFASGNYPSAPGVVNVGQPEAGADVPFFTQADMTPLGEGNEVVASLVNPGADEAALARGQEMFNRFCAVCHGEAGVGTQAYIAAKHPTVGLYDLSGTQVAGYTDQYIYGMIRVGRGLMPEYGSRITHFDRWNVVNYVRELQRRANESTADGN